MTDTRPRSTFYWAMRLMPRERRAAMFAIYDLARALDDIADGTMPADAKRAALDAWRTEIAALYAGRPTHPLAVALRPAVRRFDLPRREFEELIAGMTMDVDGPLVAPSPAQLDLYCRRVAGAVGMLSLPVFGADGSSEREFALHLGRALQLTNILRDLAADAADGRLYVPSTLLSEAGVTARDPLAILRDPSFPPAAGRLIDDAERAFQAAEASLAGCDRRRLWPALAMMAAYRTLLGRLRRMRLPTPVPVRSGRGAALAAALRAALFARA